MSLNLLAAYHNEWVLIVRSFGETNYPEDVVQEMYLKVDRLNLYDRFIENGEVHKPYVWFMLRTLYLDSIKTKLKTVSLGDGFDVENVTDMTFEQAYGDFLNLLDKEINQWYWYDKKLFELYKDTEFSLRDIEDETKISLTSIFSTIKRCKQKVKDALQEDWEDLKNNDYELL
jgi:DNA-directed RNA polymerase specialized sigma24 family protein